MPRPIFRNNDDDRPPPAPASPPHVSTETDPDSLQQSVNILDPLHQTSTEFDEGPRQRSPTFEADAFLSVGDESPVGHGNRGRSNSPDATLSGAGSARHHFGDTGGDMPNIPENSSELRPVVSHNNTDVHKAIQRARRNVRQAQLEEEQEQASAEQRRLALMDHLGESSDAIVRRQPSTQSPDASQNLRGSNRPSLLEASSSGVKFALFGPDDGPGFVDFNKPGRHPLVILTIATSWVAATSANLFIWVWIYRYAEVVDDVIDGTKLAVQRARLLASELLAPAPAVARALDVAVRTGTLRGIRDYEGFIRVLRPHFFASRGTDGRQRLLQIEVAELNPASAVEGAVFIAPAHEAPDSVELRTDRGDCAMVPGRLGSGRALDGSDVPAFSGCSTKPFDVVDYQWFRRGAALSGNDGPVWPLTSFWEGPGFQRSNPHSVICWPDLCWLPSFTYVARVADGTELKTIDPETDTPTTTLGGYFVTTVQSTTSTTTTLRRLRPLVIRATLSTETLAGAAQEADKLCRGEVLITTADGGEILAASDMSLVYRVDPATAVVHPGRVSDLPREWASAADLLVQDTLYGDENEEGVICCGGTRVTVWKFNTSEASLGDLVETLRIVVAAPELEFSHPIVAPFYVYVIYLTILPYAVLFLWACWSCYKRCTVEQKKIQARLRRLSTTVVANMRNRTSMAMMANANSMNSR